MIAKSKLDRQKKRKTFLQFQNTRGKQNKGIKVLYLVGSTSKGGKILDTLVYLEDINNIYGGKMSWNDLKVAILPGRHYMLVVIYV